MNTLNLAKEILYTEPRGSILLCPGLITDLRALARAVEVNTDLLKEIAILIESHELKDDPCFQYVLKRIREVMGE